MLTISACILPGTVPSSRPAPDNVGLEDRETARQLSDSIVNDLLNNRRAALLAKMEKEIQDAPEAEAFNLDIDRMFTAYGKPVEAEYKMYEIGVKPYQSGRSKPMRKFWYAIKTTSHEKGSHFLFVEVVTDEHGPAGSTLAIVTFPAGTPPTLQ